MRRLGKIEGFSNNLLFWKIVGKIGDIVSGRLYFDGNEGNHGSKGFIINFGRLSHPFINSYKFRNIGQFLNSVKISGRKKYSEIRICFIDVRKINNT